MWEKWRTTTEGTYILRLATDCGSRNRYYGPIGGRIIDPQQVATNGLLHLLNGDTVLQRQHIQVLFGRDPILLEFVCHMSVLDKSNMISMLTQEALTRFEGHALQFMSKVVMKIEAVPS